MDLNIALRQCGTANQPQRKDTLLTPLASGIFPARAIIYIIEISVTIGFEKAIFLATKLGTRRRSKNYSLTKHSGMLLQPGTQELAALASLS